MAPQMMSNSNDARMGGDVESAGDTGSPGAGRASPGKCLSLSDIVLVLELVLVLDVFAADEISSPTPNTPFPLLLSKSEYEDEFEFEDDWD
jgi:hypothetical protein